MAKVFETQLRQTWWFVAIVAGLSALLSNLVLRSAGMPPPEGLTQFIVYFLCLVGFWRCLEFLGWLAVLLLAPNSKLLDPPAGKGKP